MFNEKVLLSSSSLLVFLLRLLKLIVFCGVCISLEFRNTLTRFSPSSLPNTVLAPSINLNQVSAFSLPKSSPTTKIQWKMLPKWSVREHKQCITHRSCRRCRRCYRYIDAVERNFSCKSIECFSANQFRSRWVLYFARKRTKCAIVCISIWFFFLYLVFVEAGKLFFFFN